MNGITQKMGSKSLVKSAATAALLAGGLLVAATSVVSTAQAETVISIKAVGGSPEVGTLSGAFNVGDVLGFIGPASLSPTMAYLFAFTPDNPATETAYLNDTLMADPPAVYASKQETSGPDFSVAGGYFSIKLGEDTAFFKNETGASLDLTYTQTGTGAGLSHVTQYNAVPLPAAAWLFGSAVLGMAGIGYRRKQAA